MANFKRTKKKNVSGSSNASVSMRGKRTLSSPNQPNSKKLKTDKSSEIENARNRSIETPASSIVSEHGTSICFGSLPLEILCHIFQRLSICDAVKLSLLSKHLRAAVDMFLRLKVSLDFIEGEQMGWMPANFTDITFGQFLKRCPELTELYGLHIRSIAKRRQRNGNSLSVPGVIAALKACPKLTGVETSNVLLFEALLDQMPQIEILRGFKNRETVFPAPMYNSLLLSPNPRLCSLSLTGVVVPELPHMEHLHHLHLRFVQLTSSQPFQDFHAPSLKSFIMHNCAGPLTALPYVPLVSALVSARGLSRLELARVPFLGGLFQHFVEDSWRVGGFRALQKILFSICKNVTESDLGYLMITSNLRLREVAIPPALTKDSFFLSLLLSGTDFPLLDSMSLGYVDDFSREAKLTSEQLTALGLTEAVLVPSILTDTGMATVARVFPHLVHLDIYNCPHLIDPTAWMPAGDGARFHNLQELHISRCQTMRLAEFEQFISQLPKLEVLLLEQMFEEPPQGCSRVGLSAGTGLGVSAAMVSNAEHGMLAAAAAAAHVQQQQQAGHEVAHLLPNVHEGDDDDEDVNYYDEEDSMSSDGYSEYSLDVYINNEPLGHDDVDDDDVLSEYGEEHVVQQQRKDVNAGDEGVSSQRQGELNKGGSSSKSGASRDGLAQSHMDKDTSSRASSQPTEGDVVPAAPIASVETGESNEGVALQEAVSGCVDAGNLVDNQTASDQNATNSSNQLNGDNEASTSAGSSGGANAKRKGKSLSGAKKGLVKPLPCGNGNAPVTVNQSCQTVSEELRLSSRKTSLSSSSTSVKVGANSSSGAESNGHEQRSGQSTTDGQASTSSHGQQQEALTNESGGGSSSLGRDIKIEPQSSLDADPSTNAQSTVGTDAQRSEADINIKTECIDNSGGEFSAIDRKDVKTEIQQSPPLASSAGESSAAACCRSGGGASSSSRKSVGTQASAPKVNKATSTSDPAIGDVPVQVLRLVSPVLVCLTLTDVGVSDLVLSACPALTSLTVLRCRALKVLSTSGAPALWRTTYALCRDLQFADVIEATCAHLSDGSRFVAFQPPANKCDSAAIWDTLDRYVTCASRRWHYCIIEDFSPDPEATAYNKARVMSWLELFTNVTKVLIERLIFEEATTVKPERLAGLKYNLMGTSDNGARWKITSDQPLLKLLSSKPDISGVPQHEIRCGVYNPASKGQFDVTSCLQFGSLEQLVNVPLFKNTIYVYVNTPVKPPFYGVEYAVYKRS